MGGNVFAIRCREEIHRTYLTVDMVGRTVKASVDPRSGARGKYIFMLPSLSGCIRDDWETGQDCLFAQDEDGSDVRFVLPAKSINRLVTARLELRLLEQA